MPLHIKSALARVALILACVLAPLGGGPAKAAGSIPVALSQQVDANGHPLVGALLYLYVVGTVAQPQLAYQDTALTQPLPWPVVADGNGRLPMFYLADGAIHARLTDANGSVQFDYPSMLVIGPSGGGGGGAGVDPTTIFSTGDVKFRPTSETLSGWVKMNGQTVGSALSGASGRANSDTQALFIYLWTNCPDAHCPVPGGRGANGLADFNANKQITLPDWRARLAVGLDDMGAPAAGRLLASNITSGGGDGVTTPGATGGETNHTLTANEIPPHTHSITDTTHRHSIDNFNGAGTPGNSGVQGTAQANNTSTPSNVVEPAFTGITATNTAGGSTPPGGAAHNVMNPFMLGTWFMRL